jgi:Flp pilus assembly pilin Flp
MRMDKVLCLTRRCYRGLRDNCSGQDFIEYALLAGFIATAVVTMSDSIAASFVTIMSRVNSVVVAAGAN